ncbi:hypothetical protein [Altericroceibacterium xinjiangense]|uniref:hypothetical protein n=1 Tax=Altericroceibacterium xinjiangense TaxID=762261 RepID=UPI000F7E6772|nr:hypothetical protein [Altericroceibacterium xinjiangense]
MKSRSNTLRTIGASALALAAMCGTIGLAPASAQVSQDVQASQEFPYSDRLDYLPPVPTNFEPKKTEWGDPDFRGMWPIDSIGGLPLQRTEAQGNRVWLTDEEFADREARMERSRGAAQAETENNKLGLGNWVEMTGAGRRTSLLVSPLNGRLPELTPEGKRLQAAGRSSWVEGQSFDWVTDFDSWDRCISRGFPASMLPFRYNNGIRIWQAPGYFVLDLEMIHDSRIIPIGDKVAPLPDQVKKWMGSSRGHWEGNTFVIETTNIVAGDSASDDYLKRAASPLNMATIGAPPNNTIPMSEQAKVVERLTMVDEDTITYEMTYSDPVYWTAPWTVRADWERNSEYEFFEYACNEGNVQLRNYVNSSRAMRAQGTEAQPAGSE